MRPCPAPRSPPRLELLVYYHGGGFYLFSAFDSTYHAYLNALAARAANALVVSVEYRLAPEHPVLAAYADLWDALAWVLSHVAGAAAEPDPWLARHADQSRLYLSGNSAGANIAHHMAIRAGASVRGLVLVHPYFLGSDEVGSDDLDPAMRERLGRLWRVACLDAAGEDDPFINPLADGAPPHAHRAGPRRPRDRASPAGLASAAGAPAPRRPELAVLAARAPPDARHPASSSSW